jgi:hypothetical protein
MFYMDCAQPFTIYECVLDVANYGKCVCTWHNQFQYGEIIINCGVLIFVDFVVHLNYEN